jgi:hypothetical protein
MGSTSIIQIIKKMSTKGSKNNWNSGILELMLGGGLIFGRDMLKFSLHQARYFDAYE